MLTLTVAPRAILRPASIPSTSTPASPAHPQPPLLLTLATDKTHATSYNLRPKPPPEVT